MPDRDYYLSPDEKYAQFRAKFAEYVEQMLARAGERDAKSAAARIAALETRIANYQWTKVQNRDPVKTYNPMTLPEYQKLAPGFDWMAFFEGMGAPVQRLDVNQPVVHQGHRAAREDRAGVRLARVLQVPAARRLRAGAVGAIRRSRIRLPPEHTRTACRNRGRAGAARVDSMDNNMGELIGRMFVESHFGAEAKASMLAAGGQPAAGRSTARSTGSNG